MGKLLCCSPFFFPPPFFCFIPVVPARYIMLVTIAAAPCASKGAGRRYYNTKGIIVLAGGKTPESPVLCGFSGMGWGQLTEKLGPLHRKIGATSPKNWGHLTEKLAASNFGASSPKNACLTFFFRLHDLALMWELYHHIQCAAGRNGCRELDVLVVGPEFGLCFQELPRLGECPSEDPAFA